MSTRRFQKQFLFTEVLVELGFSREAELLSIGVDHTRNVVDVVVSDPAAPEVPNAAHCAVLATASPWLAEHRHTATGPFFPNDAQTIIEWTQARGVNTDKLRRELKVWFDYFSWVSDESSLLATPGPKCPYWFMAPDERKVCRLQHGHLLKHDLVDAVCSCDAGTRIFNDDDHQPKCQLSVFPKAND